jgi:putative ABC transport system substrate-binding protein
MRRRDFIAGLGGATAWANLRPLAARAQQAGKLPTVGVLITPAAPIWKPYLAAYAKRMTALGWIEGQTVVTDYRAADGREERFGEIAADFVRRKVDVILTSGAAIPAVKQATNTIPVVFAIGADPIGSGYVASLSRPGGNVTGLSLQAPEVAGKRLEMLHEVVPSLRRLAILSNIGNAASKLEMDEAETLARRLGYDAIRLEVRRSEDIEAALTGLKGADALYVCGYDPLVNSNRVRINKSATAAGLPAIYGEQNYVHAGGLMSYGPNFPDLFSRAAAEYIDKILRGAKPGDLPVQQPVKFDLTINLKTAKAMGLTMPPKLLALADEVIE